jgi:hypothetical protein
MYLLILMHFSLPLFAQQAINNDERLSYVGLTLPELIGRFGIPRTVVAARGLELWQDDVIFEYAEGDFYIYRDRVWQVRLASMYGISRNDRKAAVLLVLGDNAEDRGDYVLFPISGRNWPLMLRVNLNDSGLVSEIYIYRPDF